MSRQCAPQGHLLRGAHWLTMTTQGTLLNKRKRPFACAGKRPLSREQEDNDETHGTAGRAAHGGTAEGHHPPLLHLPGPPRERGGAQLAGDADGVSHAGRISGAGYGQGDADVPDPRSGRVLHRRHSLLRENGGGHRQGGRPAGPVGGRTAPALLPGHGGAVRRDGRAGNAGGQAL